MNRNRNPVLSFEFTLLSWLTGAAFLAMGLIAAFRGGETRVEILAVWAWLCLFFAAAFLITLTAVLGGAAGGVLFTPFLLAFTAVDSLVVRATGMILATFAGLISSGSLMRTGLTNFRLSLFGGAAYGTGALLGARGAFWVHAHMGEAGEGLLRLALGLVLTALIAHLLLNRVKIEWPAVRRVDRFTRFLNARQPYYEPSLGRVVDYENTRALPFFFAVVGIGMLSGFFGMGTGWAIVTAQNLIMGAPIKVAAANSVSIFGMGGSLAVWPYLHGGAVLPLFVAPWLCGTILGGIMASRLLRRVHASTVRYLLLAMMIFSAYGLLARSLALFGWIPPAPWPVSGLVLAATLFGCGWKIRLSRRRRDRAGEGVS